MVPPTTRRRLLSGISALGIAALAGCAGDLTISRPDEETTDRPDTPPEERPTDTPPEERTPARETETDVGRAAGGPTAVVREFVVASTEDDAETVFGLFHPAHPLADADPDVIDGFEFDTPPVEDVETAFVTESVTLDTVFGIEGAAMVFDRDPLATELRTAETSLVETTLTATDGESTVFETVLATADGEWRVLWHGEPVEPTDPGASFEAQAVESVTFDTDEDRARVALVDRPVANSVRVESTATGTHTETDMPEALTALETSVDPDGDSVVVTVTHDGTDRVVHREGYPVVERAVESVVFDAGEADSPFGATARVEFTGNQSADRITARATVSGGRSSVEPAGNATFLTVDIDGDGDEVVVSRTTDAESETIHRERYHP